MSRNNDRHEDLGYKWYAVVCVTLQSQVGCWASRSGVQWIDHRSGSPVPRSDCIGGIRGYVDIAREWGVDLTMGFKLAWIAVPTAGWIWMTGVDSNHTTS